jgi:hypothetical protein
MLAQTSLSSDFEDDEWTDTSLQQDVVVLRKSYETT